MLFRSARVLRKYFPVWDERPGAVPDCLLLYRSPRSGPAYGPRSGADLVIDRSRFPAWREATFAHRWYTDWQGPWDWFQYERLDPVPVTVGFYRVTPRQWADLRVTLRAAPGWKYSDMAPEQSPMTASWRRAGYHPTDAAYERSVEYCYKRDHAPVFASWTRRPPVLPASALDCFDAGLRAAGERGDAGERVDLYAAKAAYLLALGRLPDARAALAAARAAAAAAHYRGWALLRVEFVEQALAQSPSGGYAR